jgi:diguanylate cyclase (GGDEF)-like protein
LEAKDGSIWVGTAQGVLHIDGANNKVYTTANGLPRDYTLSLMQASDASIWVGSVNGFAVLDGDKVVTFPSSESFPADDVFHMLQDGAGVVWLATDRGLVRFRDGKFVVYGRAQGLPDETLFAVSEDRKGNFWLSSNSGLMRLARREIERLGRSEIKVMHVDLFGRSDGMSAAQINGASFPSTSVDSTGRLWLPTARGVTVLDPAHLATAQQKPVPIVLESVKFDQQEQTIAEQINLPTTVRRLEFVFAGLSYLMAERMQIRYKMHGYDSDWITATPDGAAVYMRLKPGTYQLEAQAGNSQTSWSAPFKIQVKVAAKFYEYWAFWPAVALLSGLLGVAFSRSLIAAKDRRQRALETEVALRTTELRDRNQNLAAADVEKTALLKTIQMQAEAFARQAREDALTGLPNRRFFDLRCAEAFSRAKSKISPKGKHLVVAIADVDHFKQVNDQYSHQAGDQVLKAIADTAAKTVGPVGMVARFGGEEFAIFFHDLDLETAASLLRQVCTDVQNLRFSEHPDLRVSISIGVTDCPAAESYERALMHADALLYLAKAGGRNQVVSRSD